MVRVGLIGFGYWGPNLARNLAATPGMTIVGVQELDPVRRDAAFRLYPNAHDLTGVAMADAVVIATPVRTHYDLVREALERGQHVLVAKPLAGTLAHALALQRVAAERGLVLMVDHTFVHTGAVKRIRRIVADGDLGRPLYYDSARVNLGLFQSDVDVLWDLAPHDLSILREVLPDETPTHVTASTYQRASGRTQADLAYLTVDYESGFVAHLHLSWLSPVKVRRALLAGDRRMIVYDDMEPSEKLRIYDSGVTVDPGPATRAALVDYRIGDCWSPHVDPREALASECERFLARIAIARLGDEATEVGRALVAGEAQAGVDVVRVLEAAAESARSDGARTRLVS